MRKLLIALCVLWVGVIFHLSGEPGKVSNEKSLTIVGYIKELYINNMNTLNNKSSEDKGVFNTPTSIKVKATEQSSLDKRLNVIVRKSGHFIEYFILGIIISCILIKVTEKRIDGIINVLFICLMIAVLDEFYQSFVGRTSMVRDVLIDFGGGLMGQILYIICASVSRFLIKTS